MKLITAQAWKPLFIFSILIVAENRFSLSQGLTEAYENPPSGSGSGDQNPVFGSSEGASTFVSQSQVADDSVFSGSASGATTLKSGELSADPSMQEIYIQETPIMATAKPFDESSSIEGDAADANVISSGTVSEDPSVIQITAESPLYLDEIRSNQYESLLAYKLRTGEPVLPEHYKASLRQQFLRRFKKVPEISCTSFFYDIYDYGRKLGGKIHHQRMFQHEKKLKVVACSVNRNKGVYEGYERYENDKACCSEIVPPKNQKVVDFCENLVNLIWSCAEELIYLEKLDRKNKRNPPKTPKVISSEEKVPPSILKKTPTKFKTNDEELAYQDIPKSRIRFEDPEEKMAYVYPPEDLNPLINLKPVIQRYERNEDPQIGTLRAAK